MNNILKNKLIIVAIIIIIIIVISAFVYYSNHKCSVYRKKIIEKMTNNSHIEIVVSRFNEDLSWLNEEPFSNYPVICYNKGVNDVVNINNLKKVFRIPNLGRESHTYLYHIINNYDNLADITIFLPGSTDTTQYNKKKRATMLLNEVSQHNDTVFIGAKHNDVKKELYNFSKNSYVSTSSENKNLNPETNLELASIRPFGKWYESRFPNITTQYIPYSGIIAVSRQDIKQHPKSYYQDLIKELSNSSNPEVGHYFERSWVAIFHPSHNARFINVNYLF